MRKSKFTDEQIVYAVKQIEAGVPVEELHRKYGVHKNTIYRWKQKYDGLPPSEVLRLMLTMALLGRFEEAIAAHGEVGLLDPPDNIIAEIQTQRRAELDASH